ncbi:Molybdenum cofactor biosynthesis protein hesA, heterocyst-related [Frankia canadensis]|uniref:Molybdenum cofactor biosynthesis protein hesA, heterocyst-related n=1 Tax=Frankia canadensis TaxID=1836972 RepID=A0A2I2KYQ4_9ACTN|nr:HesA/MoeB/ThiF family protein [Frankia canadensis]SNQ50787.1 Molybdenum cofactor biosynthesis protein hesA, heterocyst-related [Frankia canadensis]SOU58077.1 Molybdenum cofactor biosynthesis protein hesA, heterocyst-related [Frankia canadensis]
MVTARSHSHPRLRSICPGPPARSLPVQAAPPDDDADVDVFRRYDRQLTIPGFGVSVQRRLSQATIVVAGVGGVGGATATYLAAAGVGRLILIHPGELEEPDLNRQTLMRPERVGQSRVLCAAETLRAHHPAVEVVPVDRALTDPSVPDLIAQADVVVDARHNFPERYLINRMCVRTGVPLVVAAMNATEGYLLVVRPGEPCLRCVFPEGDPSWEPLGFPVLGSVAGTLGCLAATEALKVAGRFAEPAAGRLVHVDLWDVEMRAPRTRRDPRCPDCAPRSST